MPRLAPTPVAAVLSVVLLALWVPPPPAYAQPRPNILLIVTDDQRWDTLPPEAPEDLMDLMPTVKNELIGKGVQFTNAFAATPLCIPSRAGILTGQYPHNNDVWRNIDPHGGFETFMNHEDQTLAVWLQNAGYTTGLVGKYLNGYPGDPTDVMTIPDGWSHWVSFLEGSYYHYALNDNGTRVEYPDELPAQYSTRVLANKAVEFIQAYAESEDPIFLMFTPKAPHSPATPYPTDEDEFLDLLAYRPDNYNLDITDGPTWLTEVDELDTFAGGQLDEFRRNQLRTLIAVDRAIASILAALDSTDRLDNTMIVFMSDNGFSWGEHKWKSKVAPYEEDIRLPLVIRYAPETVPPNGIPGTVESAALNIDIAPTLLELADVPFPLGYTVDGKSLLPFITDNEHDPPPQWRNEFIVEFLHEDHPEGSEPEELVPTYCAVRRVAASRMGLDDEIYITLNPQLHEESPEKEFYALDDDPYQLENNVNEMSYEDRVGALSDLWDALCKPQFEQEP